MLKKLQPPSFFKKILQAREQKCLIVRKGKLSSLLVFRIIVDLRKTTETNKLKRQLNKFVIIVGLNCC